MSHSQARTSNPDNFSTSPDQIIPLAELIKAIEELITTHNGFSQKITDICDYNFHMIVNINNEKINETITKETLNKIKNIKEVNDYLPIAKELKKNISTILSLEQENNTLDSYIRNNLYITIQLIIDNLENNFSKMHPLMIELKLLYEILINNKTHKIHDIVSTMLASPFQMIVRYTLLVDGIKKELNKISDKLCQTDPSSADKIRQLMQSIELLSQKIRTLNETNPAMKTQDNDFSEIKTPRRKEVARRNKESQKNTNFPDVYFLDQLYEFITSLSLLSNEKNKKIFFEIYRSIYSYSYLPANTTQQSNEHLKMLRPIITDVLEENKFILTKENRKNFDDILSIFDKTDSIPNLPLSKQNELIENYFNKVENCLINNIQELIEQSSCKALIEAANLKNLRNSKSKNCLFFDSLKNEFRDIVSAARCGQSQPDLKLLEDATKEIFHAISCLKPYFIRSNDTPIKNQSSLVNKYNIQLQFRGKDSNNTLVSGLVKTPKNLLINLMRLYHYYLNTELGKKLCSDERILQNTNDQYWVDVFQDLMKEIIIRQLNENKKLDKEFFNLIEEKIEHINKKSVASQFLANLNTGLGNNILFGSRLKNTLIYIHDSYATNDIVKIGDISAETMLPTCLIRSNPTESFEDFFQKTCLLFCIHQLNRVDNFKSIISKEVIKTLGHACFTMNSKERIEFFKEKLQDYSNVGPDSFLSLLNQYIKSQSFERDDANFLSDIKIFKQKDPYSELTSIFDLALKKRDHANEASSTIQSTLPRQNKSQNN